MKSILSGLAFACGMCIAFMLYAFATGATKLNPQLGFLFVVFCIVCAACMMFARRAAS